MRLLNLFPVALAASIAQPLTAEEIETYQCHTSDGQRSAIVVVTDSPSLSQMPYMIFEEFGIGNARSHISGYMAIDFESARETAERHCFSEEGLPNISETYADLTVTQETIGRTCYNGEKKQGAQFHLMNGTITSQNLGDAFLNSTLESINSAVIQDDDGTITKEIGPNDDIDEIVRSFTDTMLQRCGF